jgi:hypothetical protein
LAADGSDMLAAVQGIGYGLLAIADQLADAVDVGADYGEGLDEIAACVAGLAGEPFSSRLSGMLGRLARRAPRAGAAGTCSGIVAGVPGSGKAAAARYADQWLRDHPGGAVRVYDAKGVPEDVFGDTGGGEVVPLRPAVAAGLDDADVVGIIRQALADAAAWQEWKAEGAGCADCVRLDPGRCAEHAADDVLAAAYEVIRGRMAGGAS